MWLWTMLGWIYLLVPFVCWAVVVRTRAVGVAVFAVLAGLALALVGLEYEWFYTRVMAELEAGYPFLASLVILAGVLGEKRLRGPRPENGFIDPVGAAAVTICVHAVVGMAIAFLYQWAVYEPFYPSLASIPLPSGLTVTDSTEGSCGTNFCSRTLTIGSTTGLPPAEVAARLRAALADDGWTRGEGEALVHPYGWLVDRRVSQIYVSGVSVELVGPELANARR